MSIIASRLSPLTAELPSFIPAPTLLLLTRKVANTSGDVRTMTSILSRAIEISSASKATSINPSHILEAIKRDKSAQSTASDQLNNIKELGLHARLVLCVVLLALHRSTRGYQVLKEELTQATTRQATLSHASLHAYYCNLLKCSPIRPLSRNDFGDIISILEVNGLVLLSLSVPRGREKLQASITLASGVRQEEVMRGLFLDQGSKQDEVKELWEVETKRITKMEQRSEEKSWFIMDL
jgi:cell division control protein 6